MADPSGPRRGDRTRGDRSRGDRSRGERTRGDGSRGERTRAGRGRRDRREREDRDWLALQCAGALHASPTLEALRETGDPGRALARLPAAWRADAARLREAERRLAGCGARLVPFGADAYPERLAVLEDAPPVLAVRGDVAALGERAVAIVGSRAATAYGLHVARRVAAELGAAGVVVVSGLARGVDAAAHEACLEAGGRTLAVQACGPDRVYPAAHRRLADRIAASGAVLSEFPPGTQPRPAFFPLRNRLISALARAVVVVEARERSGSLVTARHAADQGVEVFAVPGPITAPTSVGTNTLLRDGAAPLLDAADLFAALAWPRTPRAARDGGAFARPAASSALLSEDATAILAALAHEPAASDALARRLGRPPSALAAPLVELELAGRIAADRDGRWRRLV